jgi:hypothetical protein
LTFDEVQQKIEVLVAIRQVREKIRWKPGKDILHLKKRILLRHLPDNATIELYEKIITKVVTDTGANLYVYVYGEAHYPTLVANIESNVWLVMFSLDGILETAFPPDNLKVT